MPPHSRRWLHPQAVPRGFLRFYILTLLSRGPESGYSIIQKIDEKTEGAWRPGPGTMYPLLRSFVREGLAKSSSQGRRSGTKQYSLTAKGRKELDAMRRVAASMGRKEGVMARLFSDLLPGDLFVTMIVNRFREGTGIFRQKVGELSEPERSALMKEFKFLMEAQIAWIDTFLATSGRGTTSQARRKV